MGIVNITPDSFSDGGRFLSSDAAIEHAHRLAEEGAHILDLGAESSRPGAHRVDERDELDRLLPVLEGLSRVNVPISVDTAKASVMRAALDAGASMINDIYALRAPGAMEAVAASDCAVCLMHMQGEPRSMQVNPRYKDVVGEVHSFLAQRLAACRLAGIAAERLIIDPGFGFGKTLAHNLSLLRELDRLRDLDTPVLAGWSRKSSLGTIIGSATRDRLAASLSAALIAFAHGAKILRVHDVRATCDAIAMWRAIYD